MISLDDAKTDLPEDRDVKVAEGHMSIEFSDDGRYFFFEEGEETVVATSFARILSHIGRDKRVELGEPWPGDID